jgi:integrase
MFLSKRSNGKFYITFEQLNGKRSTVATGTKNINAAEKFLTKFQKEIHVKQDLGVIPITIVQFQFRYFRYIEPIYTTKTLKGIKSSFRMLIKHFGDINIYLLTKEKMEDYLYARLKATSPYSVRKDYVYLSQAFKRAMSEGYLNYNPCQGIRTPKLPERLPVFFSKEEFNKLYSTIDDPDLQDLVLFAVNTGLRQMEIVTLKWSMVRLEERFLMLDNRDHITKTKKVRNVPLNNAAFEILTRRKLNSAGLGPVFTWNGIEIKQDSLIHKFIKYRIKSGINPDLNFHSLRHTFASWLIQKGAPIYQVSKLLGHSNIATTEIYSHLRREDLLSTANMLNDLD